MGKLVFRYVCLGLQGLLSVALLVAVVWIGIPYISAGGSAQLFIIRFLPTCAHLLVSFILTCVMIHYSRMSFGAEAQISPVLLLSVSALDIRCVPVLCSLGQSLWIAPTVLAYSFQFLDALVIMISIAYLIMQTEISTKKINESLLFCFGFSLILSAMSPVSANTAVFLRGAYVTQRLLRTTLLVIGMTGLVCCFLSMIGENTSHDTRIKCFAIAMDILGSLFLIPAYSIMNDFLATVLFISSVTILMNVVRSRRTWM